ncbi:MAG TPA: hypothetical protein VGC99_20465 [Candidatus Tectomicrobia bacterium]|jgi:hypothetical protein
MAQATRHSGDPNNGVGLTEDIEVEYHAAIYAMDETAARWAQHIYSLRLDNTWFVDHSRSTITPGRELLSLPSTTRRAVHNELLISFVVIAEPKVNLDALRQAQSTLSTPLCLAVMFFEDHAVADEIRQIFNGVIVFPEGPTGRGEEACFSITALIELILNEGLVCVDVADVIVAIGQRQYITASRMLMPEEPSLDEAQRLIAQTIGAKRLRYTDGVVYILTPCSRLSMDTLGTVIDAMATYVNDEAVVVAGAPRSTITEPSLSLVVFTGFLRIEQQPV